MKKLIIVAGGTSDIGKSYMDYFSKDSKVIGISRKGFIPSNKNINSIKCELTNRNQTMSLSPLIDLSDIDKVILIHCIGEDVLESLNYPLIENKTTIDSKVYDTCVNTLKNIIDLIINKITIEREHGKNIGLTIVLFGAMTDRYNIPFFTSFRESKNIARCHIQNLVKRHDWIKGFVVNVSTVKSKLSTKCRPYADMTYWLSPQEVVDKSVEQIINTKNKFEEIEIFKFDPNFESDYYTNNDKIFKKWMKEMYNKDWNR